MCGCLISLNYCTYGRSALILSVLTPLRNKKWERLGSTVGNLCSEDDLAANITKNVTSNMFFSLGWLPPTWRTEHLPSGQPDHVAIGCLSFCSNSSHFQAKFKRFPILKHHFHEFQTLVATPALYCICIKYSCERQSGEAFIWQRASENWVRDARVVTNWNSMQNIQYIANWQYKGIVITVHALLL